MIRQTPNRLAIPAALTIMVASCASCPALEGGNYRLTVSEVSGDCGPIDSSTFTLAPGDLPVFGGQTGCTGLLDFADDGCFASFNRTCPGPNGAEIHFDGFSEPLSSDEARMEFTVTIVTDTDSCRSSYQGIATRL